MSLQHATLGGVVVALSGTPPYPGSAIASLKGRDFFLPCDDPWVRGSADAAHAYLDGARAGWASHPEYMDFLRKESPVHALKRAEADLYLHHWKEHLNVASVLDVGCGVGRLAVPLLERGHTIWGVDPDLESLRRLAWHAAETQGSLDLFWSSAHVLPDVRADVAIAAEVLCYVPEHGEALQAIAARVKPGGTVLLSIEARWGWAASQDAPIGAIEHALGAESVVNIEGDRWVRTYDEADVRDLVSGAGLELQTLQPSHWIPDGPLEDIAPQDLSLERLLELEQRCRRHPVWGPLHRLWLATARVPG